MKICLVNVSTTAGGVVNDCLSSICNLEPPKDINKEAMRIFLAGGISGNLREFYQKIMKVYQASPRDRGEVVEMRNHFSTGRKRITVMTI